MTTLPKAVKDWTAEDFASAFDEYNALDRANGRTPTRIGKPYWD